MELRSISLTNIRPTLDNLKNSQDMTADEHFQNFTLRPILKFQNDLIISVFRNYIEKHKGAFYTLNLSRKLHYIEHAIQKDVKFRNSLKGIIIGHFTLEEYEKYTKNALAINKRMMTMLIERLKDQMQLLENTIEAGLPIS